MKRIIHALLVFSTFEILYLSIRVKLFPCADDSCQNNLLNIFSGIILSIIFIFGVIAWFYYEMHTRFSWNISNMYKNLSFYTLELTDRAELWGLIIAVILNLLFELFTFIWCSL